MGDWWNEWSVLGCCIVTFCFHKLVFQLGPLLTTENLNSKWFTALLPG